jgi:hypothetical protein
MKRFDCVALGFDTLCYSTSGATPLTRSRRTIGSEEAAVP